MHKVCDLYLSIDCDQIFFVFCLQPSTAGNVDYCWTLAEVKVEVDEETAAEENSTHVASTEEQRLVGLKL